MCYSYCRGDFMENKELESLLIEFLATKNKENKEKLQAEEKQKQIIKDFNDRNEKLFGFTNMYEKLQAYKKDFEYCINSNNWPDNVKESYKKSIERFNSLVTKEDLKDDYYTLRDINNCKL